MPLVREHENLVVLRTFSKWAGLAGLRAGYGVMSPVLASVLMTIKQPYNLNVAAGVAMIASIEDRALLDERACNIAGTRERLAALLDAIPWITPYPSEANFILCRLDGVDAVEVKERLAQRGIFVRYFDTPMLRNHLRISVGLEEHNAPLVRGAARRSERNLAGSSPRHSHGHSRPRDEGDARRSHARPRWQRPLVREDGHRHAGPPRRADRQARAVRSRP